MPFSPNLYTYLYLYTILLCWYVYDSVHRYNYRSNDDSQEYILLIDDLLILFVLHAYKYISFAHSKEYFFD